MSPSTKWRPEGPDRGAALDQYRRRVDTYDLELALFEPIRWVAIDRLVLQPGETVLDVGCGTGLSLSRLQQRVGPTGRVIGIEQCPEMIERAQRRVAGGAAHNVSLFCAPAEEAPIGCRADAALFHFTHDVLQRPEALDHVLRHLRPGARIVATGLHWAPLWAVPVNLFVWGAAWRSVSSWRGLERPWDLLEERVERLELQELMLGGVFLAHGVVGDPSLGSRPGAAAAH